MDLHARITSVRSRTELIYSVERAIANGCRGITIGDHFYDHDHAPRHAPLALLAFISSRVEDVELGTSFLNMGLRDAISTIREFAEIAFLTSGTTTLGLGAGWDAREFEALGRSLPPWDLRLRSLEECVVHAYRLFRGLPLLDAEGGDSQIQLPRPTVVPRIALGGRSRSLLDLAARYADHFDINATRVSANGSSLRIHDRAGDRQARRTSDFAGILSAIDYLIERSGEFGRPAPTFSITLTIVDYSSNEYAGGRTSPFLISDVPAEASEELAALAETLPLEYVNLPLTSTGLRIVGEWSR